MKLLLGTLISLLLAFASCDSPRQKPLTKKQQMIALTNEKNFTMKLREKPMLNKQDSLSTEFPRIDNFFDLTDGKVIDFSVKANGCAEFMGDYEIKENTLHLTLHNLSTSLCLTPKIFKYRLELKSPETSFEEIAFYIKE